MCFFFFFFGKRGVGVIARCVVGRSGRRPGYGSLMVVGAGVVRVGLRGVRVE